MKRDKDATLSVIAQKKTDYINSGGFWRIGVPDADN